MFTVCSSVAVLPQEETRCENLINMPWSGEPSCWIRQTWLLAQQIDSLNSSTEPNCIIKVVWWSCAVCDLVLAPWWLSWPPHIHWVFAKGGDVLIPEPRITLTLHFSLLVYFFTVSAPSSYSLMRNNNPSSSQCYTVWEAAAYHCGQWWRLVEVKIF